jgi:hypothetical protein
MLSRDRNKCKIIGAARPDDRRPPGSAPAPRGGLKLGRNARQQKWPSIGTRRKFRNFRSTIDQIGGRQRKMPSKNRQPGDGLPTAPKKLDRKKKFLQKTAGVQTANGN